MKINKYLCYNSKWHGNDDTCQETSAHDENIVAFGSYEWNVFL